MMRAAQRRQLAESLVAAALARTPLSPLSETVGELELADGYRIQQETLRLRRRAGERRIGWKVGLTSAATRAEIGIHEPIAGYLLASAMWLDGQEAPFDRFIAPALEPEIAVVMGRDLAGPGITALDAARAAEGATAALEIVDSRFRDWKCGIAAVVADNAFATGLVLGCTVTPLAAVDLRLEGVLVEHNGRMAGTAAGAAALGHPLHAVAWLANHLGRLGLSLRTGDVVLTGSLTAIVRVQPADTVRASFTRLGSVGVRLP
jgi:2-keto-4-pentenoate hydratase